MGLKVVYTPQFKQFIREHPGLIRKFCEAYKNNAEEYNSGGVAIKKFHPAPIQMPGGEIVLDGQTNRCMWTVEVGGKN